MLRFNFFQWFENLKTQAKLLTVFGLVGVIIAAMAAVGIVTNSRLSTQAETVYADYTVPLTEFNSVLFNLNRYHESLIDVARTPRASDFEIELKDIAPYRAEVERLIGKYESTRLRTSSSGRDEAKDLVELKAALKSFFDEGEAAVNTIKESFENKALTSAQALDMRELGALAITVSLAPAFEKVTERHAEQIKTMSEIAKDLSDESRTMAWNATLILVVGGVVAVFLGLALGYWVAHKLSLG
ncbi:MAG TPA: MCP four helix bundle domain-containing protein, partial [Nitrospira sp.]|nr:MCP four helix bundle domain-containing protein [Nitrospira sp.]